MYEAIVSVFAPPASFKDGNVVFFSAPRLVVDAGLEPVLLEGLQDHTFGIDLCGGDISSKFTCMTDCYATKLSITN